MNLSKLFKFRPRKSVKKKMGRTQMIERVLSHPYNKWISESRNLYMAIEAVLSQLNYTDLYDLSMKNTLIFQRSNGKYAFSLTSPAKHLIIVLFDDLIKSLKSAAPRYGEAMLAHELGHLVYKHGEKKTDILKAQVQADMYAFYMGYGDELLEILDDMTKEYDSIEIRVRMSYLNSSKFAAYKKAN